MKRVFKIIVFGILAFILFMIFFISIDKYTYHKKQDRFKNLTIEVNDRKIQKVSPFIDAVRTGNIKKLKRFNIRDSIANSEVLYKRNPLIEAVKMNQYDAVKFLIENGITIDDSDRQNQTALYYSSTYGFLEITKLLIQKGADILKATSINHGSVLGELLALNDFWLMVRVPDIEEILTYRKLIENPIPIPAKAQEKLNQIINRKQILTYLIKTCNDPELIGTYDKLIYSAYSNGNLESARLMFDKILNKNKEFLEKILVYASRSNDFETVKELVEQDVNISKIPYTHNSFSYNHSPIIHAASEGNIEIFEFLMMNRTNNKTIAKKIEELENDLELNYALAGALSKNHSEIAIQLMELGASITELNYSVYHDRMLTSEMNIAAKFGDLKVIKYLIKKGIKPGKFSLQLAIQEGHKEVEKLIRKHYYKPEEINEEWAKAVIKSDQISELSRFNSLIKSGFDININSGCLLRIACENNNLSMAKFLLEKGANPNLRPDVSNTLEYLFRSNDCISKENPTALMFACKVLNFELVKFLLEKGAEVNSIDEYNHNVLFYLFQSNRKIQIQIDIFRLFCSYNIDTESAFNYLQTNYKADFTNDFIKLIDLLLEKGADINYDNRESNNTINSHFVTRLLRNGEPEILEHLFNEEIDLSYRDKDGKTLIMINSLRKKNEESYLKLIDTGFDLTEEDKNGNIFLHYIIKVKSLNLLNRLSRYDIDWNHKNKFGATPIMKLPKYRENYSELVKVLIQNDVDFNACDIHGNSVISHQMSNYKLSDELIRNGADVDLKNNDGDTPFLFCVKHRIWKNVKFLLDHGADINASNNDNKTALILIAKSLNKKTERRSRSNIYFLQSFFQYAEDANLKLKNQDEAKEILRIKGFNSFDELLEIDISKLKLELI